MQYAGSVSRPGPHAMLLIDAFVQLHLSWPLRRPTSVASEGNGPDLKQPGPLRRDGSFGGSGSAPSGNAHSCKLFCRIETSSKAGLIRHDQPCSIRLNVSDSEDNSTAMDCMRPTLQS